MSASIIKDTAIEAEPPLAQMTDAYRSGGGGGGGGGELRGPANKAGSLSVTLATDEDPITVTPSVSKGAGNVDANTQRVVLAADGPTATNLSEINAKTPALVSGATPVTGPLTDAQLRAAAVQIVEPAVTYTGAAAQTAIINNILDVTAGANALDVRNYRSASIQVVSTGTAGTFIFEQSNDNVNFVPLPVFNAAVTTGSPIAAAITATASAIVYTVPLRCNFLRLRIVTAITGGSIQAFTKLSTEPWTASVQTIAQATASALNTNVSQISGGAAAEDAAAGTSPLIMGGVVRTTNAPTTLVAGDAARLTMSEGAALLVKPYGVVGQTWNANLSLTTTTAAAIQAAAAAGLKRHITALQAINTGASAVDLIILDGATERWRITLPPNVPVSIQFPTELLTTAATALNANLSAAGTVRLNAQGYTAA